MIAKVKARHRWTGQVHEVTEAELAADPTLARIFEPVPAPAPAPPAPAPARGNGSRRGRFAPEPAPAEGDIEVEE